MPTLPLEHDRLRAVFARALRAAVPAASALLLGAGCGPCPPSDEIYLLPESDARLQPLIADCQNAAHPSCGPLCAAVSGQPLAPLEHCELHQSRDGYLTVHVGWQAGCLGGRRPQGLAFGEPAGRAQSEAGAWFAALCQLEAASVPAFEILQRELDDAEAPAELARAARAAAGDERAHTRVTARLARRFGAQPGRARVAAPARRDVAELAIENAVEGCVRETYGAALAFAQAAGAKDPVVRGAMAGIARDETRHAALAWAVARWADGRLGPAARARVREARRAAVEELRGQAVCGWTPALGTVVGLPPPQVAVALVDQLAGTLWA